MVRIDLRAQQGWTSAWQQQPPQAQGMAIHRFDLRRPQVQAVHGRQQRQGGHRCTIETQEQGCLANDAIHPLGPGLHVPDACSCLPEQRQRLGTCAGGQHKTRAQVGQGTAVDIGRQGASPGSGSGRRQQLRGQQHITCVAQADGQPRISVQRRIGFVQRTAHLLLQNRCLGRCGAQQATDFLEEGLCQVGLRCIEWCGQHNGLGPRRGQPVHQLRRSIARPGPGPHAVQTDLIHGNDHDFVQRYMCRAGACCVVQMAIQALHRVGAVIQGSHDQRQHERPCSMPPCQPLTLRETPHVPVPLYWYG